MKRIWFNVGLSNVRDAVEMIRKAAMGRVSLVASHSDPVSPVLAAADQAFLEPTFDVSDASGEVAYLAYCVEICATSKIDLFVPQRHRRILADHAAAFAVVGTRLAIPAGRETLDLLHDKAAFHDAARAAGLPMPRTHVATTVAEFDAGVADLKAAGLQGCVKPAKGVYGMGYWRLVAEQTLFAALMNPDARVISPADMRRALAGAVDPAPLLVLEYLEGPEWSLDCVCENGSLIAGVGRRKMGRAQRLETTGPIFDIARRAIARFGLSGLINVQFKAAVDPRDIRLLEINSRMSGGCAQTALSGVNLPWLSVAIPLGLIDAADIPVATDGVLVTTVTTPELARSW